MKSGWQNLISNKAPVIRGRTESGDKGYGIESA